VLLLLYDLYTQKWRGTTTRSDKWLSYLLACLSSSSFQLADDFMILFILPDCGRRCNELCMFGIRKTQNLTICRMEGGRVSINGSARGRVNRIR
jgi:hypothetical protein